MNRIDKTLERLKVSGKKMLSTYITAGDPYPEITIKLMHALVRSGADVIELGIPFSDSMAEGPVVQQAMERALAQDVHCHTVLNMVKEFRLENKDTPVVLMGYLNPIVFFGYELFAQQAAECGIDATLFVDLPPEESEELVEIWQKYGLYTLFLCSPTTTDERMVLINQVAKGYLYYVSLKGVTGTEHLNIVSLKSHYLQRKMQTPLPLMVGFGIETPEIAAQVACFADGIRVEAALVTHILDAYTSHKDVVQAGADLIHSMRYAMDNPAGTIL